ncbi:anti-sigma factor antagonist [Actinokineospora spheciospongiae]|uniref:anti-sigma factor antagonist n=1 Tax=Actinokineospora spheciospongiae TaxID=909613 RepID=UPI000D717E1A|nr:anti-sigma factor antagonist [Actinokineospora spheciospongiae]PWW66938.1 anti-anti-sigma factor [Actinokineospora spheciospongiae]
MRRERTGVHGNLIDVRVDKTTSHVVVHISGELDMVTAPVVNTALDTATATSGDRALVIDLTALSFMGSTGLAMLLETRQRCVDNGRGFAVVSPSGSPPRRALEVTGLFPVMCVEETVTAGVRRTGMGWCVNGRTKPRPGG